MRYALVETVSFTDTNGVSRPIKEMREIPSYELAKTLSKTADETPDAVAARDEAFGSKSEGIAYQIWDENIVELADVGYDWSRIQKVRIPI